MIPTYDDLLELIERLHRCLVAEHEENSSELDQRQTSGNHEEYDGLAGVVNDTNDVLADPKLDRALVELRARRARSDTPIAPTKTLYFVAYQINGALFNQGYADRAAATNVYEYAVKQMLAADVARENYVVLTRNGNTIAERRQPLSTMPIHSEQENSHG